MQKENRALGERGAGARGVVSSLVRRHRVLIGRQSTGRSVPAGRRSRNGVTRRAENRSSPEDYGKLIRERGGGGGGIGGRGKKRAQKVIDTRRASGLSDCRYVRGEIRRDFCQGRIFSV